MARLRQIAVLASAAAACRAVVTPSPPSPPSPPPVAHASVDAGVDAGDPSAARFEAMIAEHERFHDWRSTIYGSQAPNPPNAQRATPIPKTGRIPLDKTATIRAYHYVHKYVPGHAADWGGGARDEVMPYTKDGRLDGHIVPPDVTLGDRDRDDVLAALRASEEAERDRITRHIKSPSLRCIFDAHHVFVLFDAKGIPFAKLIVCFQCGQFLPIPATKQFGEYEVAILSTELRTLLFDIAVREGLAPGKLPPNKEDEEAFEEYGFRRLRREAPEAAARYARYHDLPSGVPRDAIAKSATPEQRDRFCTWIETELEGRRAEDVNHYARGAGFECDDAGAQWRFADDLMVTRDECRKKPMCNATFGAMESCLRRTFLGPDVGIMCREGPAPSCAGMLDCLPYLDWRGYPSRQ
jgi:hypothetical protein